nr:MAG TPA: hypothetical protein [Caudoviricetes sp.]
MKTVEKYIFIVIATVIQVSSNLILIKQSLSVPADGVVRKSDYSYHYSLLCTTPIGKKRDSPIMN